MAPTRPVRGTGRLAGLILFARRPLRQRVIVGHLAPLHPVQPEQPTSGFIDVGVRGQPFQT